MSPEDPNNPGLNTKNPDLSSVPLPEPAPIKSPYAPVGGTLGDVADDMAKDDQAIKPKEPAESKPENALPTAGIVSDESDQSIAQNTDSTTDVAKAPTLKMHKIPKKIIIFAAIGLVVLILIIVLVIIILGATNGEPGSNGKTGSMFNTKSVFIPKDKEKNSFALYNGKDVGEYEYEIVSHFVDGYALVRKDGKFGIIDEKGQATVDFGKYDNIIEYGGLYGATKDDVNELIDGQGRVIRKYKDEFENYGEIERAERAAYTIFREGGKKYSIYNPRGEKLSTFESEDAPTISSTNTIDSTSTTAVFYSDGAYIYDDAGKEVSHLERKIAKKYLITDASTNEINIIRDEIRIKDANTILYSIPNNNSHNAVIINNEIHEYDSVSCSAIIYERHYSTNNRGYLACARSTADGYQYINEKGQLTKYILNTNDDISKEDIFPLSAGNYVLKENIADYGLYYGGKKVTSFKTSQNTISENDRETITEAITYNVKNSFANNYIVQKITEKKVKDKKTGITSSGNYTYDVSIYNEKGKKVCSFDGSFFASYHGWVKEDKRTIKGYVIGFNRSGIGVNMLANGNSSIGGNLAIVNDKCQRIGNQSFSSAGAFGFWGSSLIVKGDLNYYYIDQNGKLDDKAYSLTTDSTYMKQLGVKDFWGKFSMLDGFNTSDPDSLYDNELLYYGKKTGINAGYLSTDKNYIVSTDTCLLVKAVVGKKVKMIANGKYPYNETYQIIETRAINNSGEVIYEKKEEVKQ